VDGGRFDTGQVEGGVMERGAFLALRARRTGAIVVEVLHLGLQKIARAVQGLNLKPPHTLAENVDAAIGIALYHSDDPGRAADQRHLFPLGADDPERRAGGETFADHLAIALLKNMERERRTGEQHHVERKERDFHDTPLCSRLASMAQRD